MVSRAATGGQQVSSLARASAAIQRAAGGDPLTARLDTLVEDGMSMVSEGQDLMGGDSYMHEGNMHLKRLHATGDRDDKDNTGNDDEGCDDGKDDDDGLDV